MAQKSVNQREEEKGKGEVVDNEGRTAAVMEDEIE